jgi:predicted  nucleic acid-binding Zn-ribbon protein
MKSNSLLVLACLFSGPSFAQSLPDEINYAPHEALFKNYSVQASQAESSLNQSRADLQEAQRFIQEMTGHLVELENQIREEEAQIAQNQRRIPQLQGEISGLRFEQGRLNAEIKRLQSEEQNLRTRHQQEYRNLAPLEDMVSRKQQKIREVQNELNNLQRVERDAAARLSLVHSQMSNLERQIEEERSKQRQMQGELNSIDSRITQNQSSISQAESQISSLSSSLTMEKQKLAALNSRVEQYRSELSALRSQGASPDQIKELERKINAASSTRDNTASEIKTLEAKNAKLEQEIRTHHSRIEILRRDQQSLPSRISQSSAREQQLVQERQGHSLNISRLQREYAEAHRHVESRESILQSAKADLRVSETHLMQQRQQVENLARHMDSIRSEINLGNSRSSSLDQQVVQLNRNIQELQNQIPRLQSSIRESKNEISQGHRELTQARTDEQSFKQSISLQEKKLTDLKSRRDEAHAQMNQRLSLYNRYLTDARDLGASQSQSAVNQGEREGASLAQKLSKQNGMNVGQELGLAQARHWGAVRGEVQGFESGYADGLASPEDRARGQQNGLEQGKKDAHVYAQTHIKPVIFEELVLERFKLPLVKAISLKSNKILSTLVESSEMGYDSIPPLSSTEITRSNQIRTLLDEQIILRAKEVKAIELKAQRLADPAVAYVEPSQTPYGSYNCSQVYKNLAVFKAACEASYKETFSSLYKEAVQQRFFTSYAKNYQRELDHALLTQRDLSYSTELSQATKVGRAQGIKEGQQEIYQQVFEQSYKKSYASELIPAENLARQNAASELQSFLNIRPLLTLTESRFNKIEMRGGDEIEILSKVKNVSKVPLNAPVLIQITHLENAEIKVKEAVLNYAAPMSQTTVPALKIKVLGNARAGQQIVVKGMIELPGDLYKPQRQERFEIRETLVANPAHKLDMSYNKFPKIKGVFRRNIHFLTANLRPEIEDIEKGYRLSLSAKGENAHLIELKEDSFETGALKQGQAKELHFSYTFADAAKGKAILLEMSVDYNGKVIKREDFELTPQ